MFLLVYIKQIGITLLVFIFVQKYEVDLLVFFSLDLVSIFEKNDAIWSFFVKFLKLYQCFFIKIEVVNKNGLLYWYN